MSPREWIAVGLASVLAALSLYNGIEVMTDHLGSSDFPEHAKFHTVLGGGYLVLLSGLAAVVSWSSTLRRVGGGLLLGAVLLAAPTGFLAAVATVPSGSPGMSYVVLAVVALVLGFAAASLVSRRSR